MNSIDIEKKVKEIRNKIDNKIEVNDNDYIEFKRDYEVLYKICKEKKFDSKQLNFFLYKLKQIEDNKVSQHDASVSIGTLLVDKYVPKSLMKSTEP
jgi:hypothetical protein